MSLAEVRLVGKMSIRSDAGARIRERVDHSLHVLAIRLSGHIQQWTMLGSDRVLQVGQQTSWSVI